MNYGASPGDADHDAPYLHVGPWSVTEDDLWNVPFGASWSAADVADVDVAVEHLVAGQRAARPG